MLVAHDLLLLLLDDETGKIGVSATEPDKALAGAILIDLAGRELVGLTDKGRLAVHASQVPPEPALHHGLAVVKDREGQKPQSVLGPIAKGLREQLAGDLVEAGILRQEEHKVLGLFRTTRLPAANSSYEDELRARLAAVLVGTAAPDQRTGPLVALLHAMGVIHKVVPADDKRDAKRRAKEIAEGDWAAAAVRKAVQDVQSAIMIAVMVSTTATTAGNS